MNIRVEIKIYHIPTAQDIGNGVQWLSTEAEFDQLKDLLSSAVRGGLTFLKLSNVPDEIFIGQDMLMQSRITLKRCENEPT